MILIAFCYMVSFNHKLQLSGIASGASSIY